MMDIIGLINVSDASVFKICSCGCLTWFVIVDRLTSECF